MRYFYFRAASKKELEAALLFLRGARCKDFQGFAAGVTISGNKKAPEETGSNPAIHKATSTNGITPLGSSSPHVNIDTQSLAKNESEKMG